ncbi:MAG TPA: CHASE3 domain-containing protein [Chitinophagaceae bacterium]|jgi:signal transduction histidine kinase|nr:CHASE3 domain-containing protein [Chitinophagaceae bacterium]
MLTTGSFRVKSGYLTAFLLLLLSYFLIFLTLQQFLKQSKWIEHTDLVINNLETLSADVYEAESSARGYVILNDTSYLRQFYASTKKVDSLSKNIDSLTSDNIAQQKIADTLKMLIQEKLGRMYRGVLLFKEAGNVITEEMKSGGEIGKRLTILIKAAIQKMENQERRYLTSRREALRGVSISIKIITITSLIIAILLSVYSFVTYSKESKAKLRADEQANLYRKQLENKVKELQEANIELQELRSLEKFTATGRIARTIAHEIRNPLTNIALASEQIQASSERDEETTMLLDMINRNATRINQMISELLTSTKFALLQYSKIKINALLDETLELAKDRIELKHIKLEKKYSSDGCEVLADIEKIKIAFLNIIVNAVEAMDKEKGVLEIFSREEHDKCIIDIKDNGTGMDEETRQKLFDPYFTKKSGGAGLGLTHTQNIILNHKGNISVKSWPGEGTIFTITLSIIDESMTTMLENESNENLKSLFKR